MAKRGGKTKGRRIHPREAALKKRAKALIKAEREYWQKENVLVEGYNDLRQALGTDASARLKPLSSVVWALRDGAAFVRYETFAAQPSVDLRVADLTLEKWRRNATVPTKNGEVPTAPFGINHGVQLVSCVANGNEIPYAAFLLLKYGEPSSLPSVERAVEDFRLTLLGLAVHGGILRAPVQRHQSDKTIGKLEQELAEFCQLLEDAPKEPELQAFLKKHPLILDPSGADVVPKKKLGEDFVTDFVLISHLDHGPRYTLVEIEPADVPILTTEGSLSKYTTHALHQTREWDIWLEKHKAYMQDKLIGFESPEYLIIIGRSNNMTAEQKAFLRSYNRGLKNTQLLTYDDVVVSAESHIQKLKLYCHS